MDSVKPFYMGDIRLNLQIANLKILIALEVEKYKIDLAALADNENLQTQRDRIKNLKDQLQILVDKENADK
jgi:hypothetical protein